MIHAFYEKDSIVTATQGVVYLVEQVLTDMKEGFKHFGQVISKLGPVFLNLLIDLKPVYEVKRHPKRAILRVNSAFSIKLEHFKADMADR